MSYYDLNDTTIDNANFYDFNTAESLSQFNLIPSGTLAKVSLHIKRGAYNDPAKGWTDGYATQSRSTGAVYLACEFTILEGEYAKRKIWSNIGLYSDKNDNSWGKIGRSFIKSIINSANNLTDKDQTEEAKTARHIQSFAALEGMEFVAKISIAKDSNGNEHNIIKAAIGPEHKDYAGIMASIAKPNWA